MLCWFNAFHSCAADVIVTIKWIHRSDFSAVTCKQLCSLDPGGQPVKLSHWHFILTVDFLIRLRALAHLCLPWRRSSRYISFSLSLCFSCSLSLSPSVSLYPPLSLSECMPGASGWSAMSVSATGCHLWLLVTFLNQLLCVFVLCLYIYIYIYTILLCPCFFPNWKKLSWSNHLHYILESWTDQGLLNFDIFDH